MFNTILFDLDGTLTEPFEGISNSIVYALKKFGITINDKAPLKAFIGPPLLNSFTDICGFSEENAALALQYYREYFSVCGLYENSVYNGIPELLSALKSRQKQLIVATSKPEVFAIKILNHFNLSRYFDHITGATLDNSRVLKSDVIACALKDGGVTKKSEVAMVGDRKHDILGAKANGIKSIGVLYGYGSKQELLESGADYLANSPQSILDLV